MRRTNLVTALAATVALVVGGCSNSASSSEDDVNEMFSRLMQRPDIESVQADYLALLEQLRTRLVEDLGITPFIPNKAEPMSASGCPGELSAIYDAQVNRYTSGSSPGNISDAHWPRAVEIVTGITSRHGFGAPKTVINRHGDHEIAIYDTYGAELIFGTAQNTILSLATGCHLTHEAKKRGKPEPSEYNY